jgi:hypothetical protein
MTKVIDKGRPFSVEVLKSQIGFWNIGAISGGRVLIDGATYNEQDKTNSTRSNYQLPMGYRVRITLGWDDTYTVSRVIVKNTKKAISEVSDKGTLTGVFADQVGEIAYKASCFVNVQFGEKESA